LVVGWLLVGVWCLISVWWLVGGWLLVVGCWLLVGVWCLVLVGLNQYFREHYDPFVFDLQEARQRIADALVAPASTQSGKVFTYSFTGKHPANFQKPVPRGEKAVHSHEVIIVVFIVALYPTHTLRHTLTITPTIHNCNYNHNTWNKILKLIYYNNLL